MEILENFRMIGLSHWKTPVEVREKFALSKEQIENLLQSVKERDIKSILPISTCNRTEIYAFAEKAEVLINLLCEATNNSSETFYKHGYIKESTNAVKHLFKVTTGLDSQIAGDAQVTGQVNESLQLSLK